MDNRKLKQLLDELTEIAGIRFGLYDEEGDCLATTAEPVEKENIQQFTHSLADEITVHGQQYLKFQADETPLVLLVDSRSPESHVIGRMAMSQIRLFLKSTTKDTDPNACVAEFLSGELSTEEFKRQISRLKLKDAPRIVYLLELSQTWDDAGDMRTLRSLFANGKQDFFFQKSENCLVLIKTFEKDVSEEQIRQFALTTVDTMQAELMIKTRIGYSNLKQTITELQEGYKEASLTLHISGIFQEQNEICGYSRLGIARLIYELPADLCRTFLQEVFGDTWPDEKIDEELQVTIRKFFDNNLNISETARQLYLHRNTLVYRLERLEKTIGLDIRRFDDAMTFQIAMMVLAHYRTMNE